MVSKTVRSVSGIELCYIDAMSRAPFSLLPSSAGRDQ